MLLSPMTHTPNNQQAAEETQVTFWIGKMLQAKTDRSQLYRTLLEEWTEQSPQLWLTPQGVQAVLGPLQGKDGVFFLQTCQPTGEDAFLDLCERVYEMTAPYLEQLLWETWWNEKQVNKLAIAYATCQHSIQELANDGRLKATKDLKALIVYLAYGTLLPWWESGEVNETIVKSWLQKLLPHYTLRAEESQT